MSSTSLFRRFLDWLDRLLGGKSQPRTEPVPIPPGGPRSMRVSLIIFDPSLAGQDGRRLSHAMGWNDPDRLVSELIADLHEVSHGYAEYVIAERILVDEFPAKEDSFRYSEAEYLRLVRERRGMHEPDAVDYGQILSGFDLPGKINRGEIDEVWTVSFPWAGFYESRMVGPGAFWCNAPPLLDGGQSRRRFIIMAFNYERGVGEMLESYGHRAESILAHAFRAASTNANLWERFTRHEKSHPGRAEAGNVHFAPNSRQDYDWGNPAPVLSRWRAWLNFPDLTGEPQLSDSRDWGDGEIRAHHKWWFHLMPHIAGQSLGIANNWWVYIVDPNEVR